MVTKEQVCGEDTFQIRSKYSSTLSFRRFSEILNLKYADSLIPQIIFTRNQLKKTKQKKTSYVKKSTDSMSGPPKSPLNTIIAGLRQGDQPFIIVSILCDLFNQIFNRVLLRDKRQMWSYT